MDDAIYSSEQVAEVRAYKDPLYASGLVHEVLYLLLWICCLRFFIARLYVWSERSTAALETRFPAVRALPVLRALPASFDRLWGGPGWGAALLFAGSMALFADAVSVPLNIYFEYFHEHRFGMSTESFGSFCWDYAKGVLINICAMGVLAFGMLGVARRLPRWWLIIGIVGAAGLAFSAALDPYRGRLYFDQEPLPAGEAREAITALMSKAKIDFKDVLLEKTLSKNVRLQAYFAGKGPTRTIVINDAALKELTTDELVAVIGHEAGHVHEARWAGQLGSSLALLAFLFAIEKVFQIAARRRWWGVTERADIRTLPLILLVFGLCSEIVWPLSATFQRQRELDADRYGVELTGNPDAFRRMLIKAARVNKMDADPPRWVVLKGWTHPPIRERLDAIDDTKKTGGR